jgi:hypothetical protein
MAGKYRIGATSTVCSGARHNWESSLAPNYRVCVQCRTVEFLRDGQWVSPAGRSAKSSGALIAAPLMQVRDQDLQAKSSSLVEMPLAQPVVTQPVQPGLQVVQAAEEVEAGSASEPLSISPDLGAHWHRRDVHRLAGEQGWKSLTLKFKVDRRESSYVIAGEEAAWRRFVETASFQQIIEAMNMLQDARKPLAAPPIKIVPLYEDRSARERLLRQAKLCGWVRLSFVPGFTEDEICIGPGAKEWAAFVQTASYDQVIEAALVLHKLYPKLSEQSSRSEPVLDRLSGLYDQQVEVLSKSEQEVRASMLLCAESLEWRRVSYKSADTTYMVGPGEEEWRTFALRGVYGRVIDVSVALKQHLRDAPQEMTVEERRRTSAKRARAELAVYGTQKEVDG